MSIAKIESDIKQRIFSPLYLFEGQEAYYIDRLVALIESSVLNEAEKGFNLSIFYGKDADPQMVISAARRYPMLSEHSVVILKEAQQMRDLNALLTYAENPLNSTLFIIAYKYKSLPKNSKLYKVFKAKGVTFRSEKIRDYQVARWISDRLAETDYKISPPAAKLLEEYLGADLAKVESELNKLFLNIEKGHTIAVGDIEKYIGISKDYNIFELNKAIMLKDLPRLYRILENFRSNMKAAPLPLLSASLYNLFTRIYLLHFIKSKPDRELAAAMRVNPFFLKDYRSSLNYYSLRRIERIFAWLLQYDLRFKGVNNGGTSDAELMRELIWKIVH